MAFTREELEAMDILELVDVATPLGIDSKERKEIIEAVLAE